MALTQDDILSLDQEDSLSAYREEFLIPACGNEAQAYLCGNSLGLQPKGTADAVRTELDNWARLGVEGHFSGDRPWTTYHERLNRGQAALAGALSSEVATMNTLTVNLHLLLTSFFEPRGFRNRIVIERQPFPSDRYVVESQLRLNGLDPAECLVELGAKDPDRTVEETQVEDYLDRLGERVALVLWPGVHYATGQRFDLRRIAQAARSVGAVVGFDLAHAIGNVPLALHDDGPDFAAWCTYKYLNGGPGAIAAAFVHQRHHDRTDLPRLRGWWGVDLDRRFLMEPEFHGASGADAWQLSTPPILSMAPLSAALDLFEQAGMERLRRKSVALTGNLEQLIEEQAGHVFDIITPREPERRGCQLSLRVRAGREAGRALYRQLLGRGVVGDWREPDVIRVAPAPLYNCFEDGWRFVRQAVDLAA